MNEEKKKKRLFLAPFQPELEEAFFDFVKSRKARDPLTPLVVLVGSNLLELYLRRLFVQRGFNHINIRFLTFIDLARALAEEPLNEERRRPLPRFGELVAVLSLVEKIGNDSYFKPIADRRGFQRGLAATFRDLAEGGMEELPVKDGQKLIDLNILYQAFRSMTGKEFYDNSQLLFRASAAVRNFPEAFGGKELILHGFYAFTAAQKKLVQACAANLEVAAFLPWRESPAFAYASPVLEWYKTLGFQVEVPRESIRKERSSVEILQQGLFGQRPGKIKALDDHSLLFLSAPSEAQEIREMAREILRLAGEENIPFHLSPADRRGSARRGRELQPTGDSSRVSVSRTFQTWTR